MTVHARLKLDDDSRNLTFDAVPFLRDAETYQIQGLADAGFGGDYAADDVAWFVKDLPGFDSVKEALDHNQKNEIGFEVRIDEEEARAWLAENRPDPLAPRTKPAPVFSPSV